MARTTHNKVVLSATENVSKTLANIQKNFKSFSKSAQNLGKSMSNLASISFAPLAGGLTAAGAAIRNSVKAMADYGTSVDDASRSLGVAADSLQAFRYAADLGGSSASEMDGAIAMLNKNMANAVSGKNKDLVELFNKLGISMQDANGQTKTAADLMPELADAIAKQSDQTAKAYIANLAFGRSGQNLIKTLNGGAEGLDAARKEAEKFGLVMSKEDVAAATEFGDSLTRTQKAVQGVQNSIGSKLLPVLQPMLDGMNNWIAQNREWLATTIADGVKDLSQALKDIDFKKIIEGAMNFIKGCVKLFNALGGVKTVAIAVSAVFAGKVVASILAVGKALMVLAANPIGAVVVAIAGAVAVGVALYKNWDRITEGCKRLKDAFTTSFPVISKAFEGAFAFISTIWNNFKVQMDNLIDFVANVFTGQWGAAWENVKNIFKAAFENLAAFIKLPINSILSMINTVFAAIGSISLKIPDWVPGMGGNEYKFDMPQIPMLAQGGIATKPTLAMVGEGRENEAILPLSRLSELIGGRASNQNEIVLRIETPQGVSATVERSKLAPLTHLEVNTGYTR